jgi:cell division septation protein DedD
VSDNHNFDDDEDFFEDEYVPTINRWKLLGAALAIVIVAGFGIGIWYAYDQGVKKGVKLAPPIIKADETPVKEQPEDPGGMEIPHQDKKVFEVLKAEPEEEKVETLMAPPEQVVEEAAPVDIAEDPALKKSSEPETLMSKAEDVKEEVKAEAEATADTVATKVEEAKEEIADKVEEPKEEATEAVEKVEEAPAVSTPPKAAEPKMAPGGEAYRVQLGAFRSSDAAKKAWRDLQKKHELLLGGEVYKVVSVEIKGKGVFHRLQAGAFAARADATTLCEKLKAEKQDCLVAKS